MPSPTCFLHSVTVVLAGARRDAVYKVSPHPISRPCLGEKLSPSQKVLPADAFDGLYYIHTPSPCANSITEPPRLRTPPGSILPHDANPANIRLLQRSLSL
ncbi:hypothetical protein BDN70DRAFT_937700 [Pholiota conissans]|uniref:Uncharacterized protein n=1 Tax=Pholiota conissans TaxID=109636 RepID=A0A9P6CUE6_9AGAR|nr:hypothetical protein BDN70DRAFT_937700 [Pholiota conissans]